MTRALPFYGEKGLYTMDSFADTNLPTGLESALVSMANNSLAKGTWSTYTTAYKHVVACQDETGRNITFPMTKNDVLLFTSWLLRTRGIKASSAEVYLSALRQIHLVKGLEVPTLCPDIVKTIIQGAKNKDTIRDRLEGTPKRLPVIISLMKMI